MDGSKIFEYRRTFPNEEIMAYIYVSSPVKMIVGRIHLGKRIDINTWKEQYKADKEVCERIDDFLTRHAYAMPVLSFQMTKEIELETGSYSTIFISRNRKKLWSQPSFTIQASGRQAHIHPAGAPMEHVGKDKYVFSDEEENNRRLSVKEIARIQTFPDWYEFSRGTSSRNDNAKLDLVYKQIGNAVPVRLALAVAEPIAEFAKKCLKMKNEEKRYAITREEKKRLMV